MDAAKRPGIVNTRANSYAWNCMNCHAHDVTKCFAPSRTILFIEATNLGTIGDYRAGMVSPPTNSPLGPSFGITGILATRHNQRGFLLMSDIHIEKMKRRQFDLQSISDTRFWFPNSQTSVGGGGIP
jgi:hypothetical protein